MSTTTEILQAQKRKLQKTLDNKASIKQAITNKRGGIDIGENQSTWASEIENIEPLLDTLDITENGEVDVKNYKKANVIVGGDILNDYINFLQRDLAYNEFYNIPYGVETLGNYALFKIQEVGKSRKIKIPKSLKYIKSKQSDSPSQNPASFDFYYEGTLLDWVKIQKGEFTSTNISNSSVLDAIITPSSFGGAYFLYINEKALSDETKSLEGIEEIAVGGLSFLNFQYTQTKELFVPKTIKNIGAGAFFGIKEINKIEFEEGAEIERIPNWCFSNITSYSTYVDIKIPKCKIIGFASFLQTPLKTFKLEEGIEEVEDNAFYRCQLLQELKLSSTLKTIGTSAFYYCSNITEIVLPESITELKTQAFGMCYKLKTIIIESSTPFTIGSYALSVGSGSKIYVPKGTSEAFKSATNWSSYASYIFEKYVVVFNIPTALVNNETITYSIDGGKTYQQFTNSVLSLQEVATIKIKSTDSTQTILIGTTSGGNDVGTISNSELTFSFTTDTNVYLTIQ